MILKKEEIKSINMFKNSIFIYPTDTIYGIGCDATNSELVKRIREIKQRDKKPFSVIAPSKEWIKNNCEVNEKWLGKLPGKYTLILNLKEKNAISKQVNNNSNTIGVRIPKNWFSKIVNKLNFPVVTTSVNLSGEKNMTSINDLNQEIKDKVDFIIDEGVLSGKPSTVVILTTKKEKTIKRN